MCNCVELISGIFLGHVHNQRSLLIFLRDVTGGYMIYGKSLLLRLQHVQVEGYVLRNRRLKTPTACRGNNPLGEFPCFSTYMIIEGVWLGKANTRTAGSYSSLWAELPWDEDRQWIAEKEYEGEDPFFVDTFVRWIATKRCLQNKERSCHVQAQNPSNIMWGAAGVLYLKPSQRFVGETRSTIRLLRLGLRVLFNAFSTTNTAENSPETSKGTCHVTIASSQDGDVPELQSCS